ncbi:DUF1844 domain-containing protein [Desulfobacterales bacterium HSG16]|nr:DUF1844 domain-containing protein [Desulfobacterales bacterium HSG16]
MSEKKDAGVDSPSGGEKKSETGTPLPAINFATFIVSLNSSAYAHMGMLEAELGKTSMNLPLAKQVIDIIAMLEEKTKGNLTSDEETMLESILYDLRIKYVKQSQ